MLPTINRKPMILVFYEKDGKRAKTRAREIVADRGTLARVYDVTAWMDTPDGCSSVEIMDDVSQSQRRRVEAVFGHLIAETPKPASGDDKDQSDDSKSNADNQTTAAAQTSPPVTGVPMRAEHRGEGKWFVMRGDVQVAGPLDRLTARKMAVA